MSNQCWLALTESQLAGYSILTEDFGIDDAAKAVICLLPAVLIPMLTVSKDRSRKRFRFEVILNAIWEGSTAAM